MKLVSWNVNGLAAILKKDFLGSVRRIDADILAVQETKLQATKLDPQMERIDGYRSLWSFSTRKKGYSGVGIYTRIEPREVGYGIGIPEYDEEGRILWMDLGTFVLFNVYFPNGQMGEDRLSYKLRFYEDFFAYTDRLRQAGRSVVVAGDFNTAHNEIDLKNPKANETYSGFLRIERDWMDRIVERGYVDTFRTLYPDTVKYSWWTYRFGARRRNIGWRIDYFFVSRDMIDKGWVQDAFIDNDIEGSDHCPVGLILNPQEPMQTSVNLP
ncbi:MAG: exodeoxyribonuclease III [Thermodesulfobacteriota bacterium]